MAMAKYITIEFIESTFLSTIDNVSVGIWHLASVSILVSRYNNGNVNGIRSSEFWWMMCQRYIVFVLFWYLFYMNSGARCERIDMNVLFRAPNSTTSKSNPFPHNVNKSKNQMHVCSFGNESFFVCYILE